MSSPTFLPFKNLTLLSPYRFSLTFIVLILFLPYFLPPRFLSLIRYRCIFLFLSFLRFYPVLWVVPPLPSPVSAASSSSFSSLLASRCLTGALINYFFFPSLPFYEAFLTSCLLIKFSKFTLFALLLCVGPWCCYAGWLLHSNTFFFPLPLSTSYFLPFRSHPICLPLQHVSPSFLSHSPYLLSTSTPFFLSSLKLSLFPFHFNTFLFLFFRFHPICLSLQHISPSFLPPSYFLSPSPFLSFSSLSFFLFAFHLSTFFFLFSSFSYLLFTSASFFFLLSLSSI